MCSHSSWTLELVTSKLKVKLSVEEHIAVVVSHLEPSFPELYSFEKGRRTFRVGKMGEEIISFQTSWKLAFENDVTT